MIFRGFQAHMFFKHKIYILRKGSVIAFSKDLDFFNNIFV